MIVKIDAKVEIVFANYPDKIRERMLALRKMIIETAEELDRVISMEETLKWGEPSYLTKDGGILRMDWKEKSPDQYAIYFKCTSRLVETFKTVFSDVFEYQVNRAIIFQMDDSIPKKELKNVLR